MRYNAKRNIHVRKRKINLLCSLRSNREVCKYDIDFTCLKILYSARSFGRYIVDLYSEVFSDPLRKVYIISLILSVLINISERVLIGKYTDVDLSVSLDLIKCPVYLVCICCCAVRCGNCGCGSCASRKCRCDCSNGDDCC